MTPAGKAEAKPAEEPRPPGSAGTFSLGPSEAPRMFHLAGPLRRVNYFAESGQKMVGSLCFQFNSIQ